ncbi:class I SAM-dependent methyltransferase [Chloroflexota bacterium]
MAEGIFGIKQAHKLDTPGRIIELKPRELLEDIAGITKGMISVDFGSGTGVFALPMADLVGNKGKVYAVDNSVEMLAHIKAKNPPPNLILLHSDVERTRLNDHVANICLLAFILHEVKQPQNLIKEAYRLLKPEGTLVIVEWKADMDSPGPPLKRRILKEQIEQLFGQIGLTLDTYIDWSQNHYVAVGKQKVAADGIKPVTKGF